MEHTTLRPALPTVPCATRETSRHRSHLRLRPTPYSYSTTLVARALRACEACARDIFTVLINAPVCRYTKRSTVRYPGYKSCYTLQYGHRAVYAGTQPFCSVKTWSWHSPLGLVGKSESFFKVAGQSALSGTVDPTPVLRELSLA